jgi:hypothetical protein
MTTIDLRQLISSYHVTSITTIDGKGHLISSCYRIAYMMCGYTQYNLYDLWLHRKTFTI